MGFLGFGWNLRLQNRSCCVSLDADDSGGVGNLKLSAGRHEALWRSAGTTARNVFRSSISFVVEASDGTGAMPLAAKAGCRKRRLSAAGCRRCRAGARAGRSGDFFRNAWNGKQLGGGGGAERPGGPRSEGAAAGPPPCEPGLCCMQDCMRHVPASTEQGRTPCSRRSQAPVGAAD
jgi:hypothetical protein